MALDDDGSIPPLRVGELLDVALAGAQLLDSTLQEQVRLRNSRVETSHLAPPSGVALRRSLSRIAEQPKPRKPASMIFKLTKGLRKALLRGLADRGLVGMRRTGPWESSRLPATRRRTLRSPPKFANVYGAFFWRAPPPTRGLPA